MAKCEYCGIEWGNRETYLGSGVYIGGVHWCDPMIAVGRIKDEIARLQKEADPVWQAEQKRIREEAAESKRKLIEALDQLAGYRRYDIEV